MGHYSDDELHRMHVKGQISDDQYLAGIEANCKHVPEIEESGNSWIEWCTKCGKKLDSGSVGSGTVKVKGGGCVVAALIVFTAALLGIYGFIQLVA